MANSIINRKFKYTYSHAAYILIGINVVLYILSHHTRLSLGGVPLLYSLSLIPATVRGGYVWQVFTYMFMHGSLPHLFFNMYALLVFGDPVERELGSREFLLYYLLCGTLAGVANYLILSWSGSWLVVVLGASGAIYSILFLVSVLAPSTTVLLFFILPLKMPVAVLVMLAIEVFTQVTGLQSGVAPLVHLSGIFFAWIYCAVRYRINPIEAWKRM